MKKSKPYKVWQERDGTRTPISQLRTSHLEFIIRKIERSNKELNKSGIGWRLAYLPYLKEELAYRKRLDSNQKTT